MRFREDLGGSDTRDFPDVPFTNAAANNAVRRTQAVKIFPAKNLQKIPPFPMRKIWRTCAPCLKTSTGSDKLKCISAIACAVIAFVIIAFAAFACAVFAYAMTAFAAFAFAVFAFSIVAFAVFAFGKVAFAVIALAAPLFRGAAFYINLI